MIVEVMLHFNLIRADVIPGGGNCDIKGEQDHERNDGKCKKDELSFPFRCPDRNVKQKFTCYSSNLPRQRVI